MQLEKKQCGSLELPCYVNTKDLEPGDLLLCESEMLAKKRKKQEGESGATAGSAAKSTSAKKSQEMIQSAMLDLGDVSQFHQNCKDRGR